MTNYLNQIESDLYKLNSITNGSGEVVEMVAELKEKYEKAKAFDVLYASFDKGDKDLSKADFDEALEYESGESEIE